MEIKTYQELIAPDERSKLAAFIEARLPDGGFDMEIAARVVQEHVSRIDLHSDVPEVVADIFERVRKVYCYGLFEYEMFTVAQDQAILLLEQALRERFQDSQRGHRISGWYLPGSGSPGVRLSSPSRRRRGEARCPGRASRWR